MGGFVGLVVSRGERKKRVFFFGTEFLQVADNGAVHTKFTWCRSRAWKIRLM